MLCRVFSATCIGLDVVPITVEVSISQGVGVFLIGLPDAAVKESLLRVTTAMQGYEFRIPGKKTVINLAPANIRKEGSAYDLAIAVGLLAASGQIADYRVTDFLILGELALDGKIRAISGALPIAIKALELGYKACILPKDSAREAAAVGDIDVFGASDLREVIDILNGEGYIDALLASPEEDLPEDLTLRVVGENFANVLGQDFAKRGMEIAAAGNHNLLLIGPPGAGKSFMAKCLSSILPKMSRKEALETTVIYSVAGKTLCSSGLMMDRPFRSPHHTASMVSLVGGGQNAMPGEISLAHNGVLYLDEMAQYPAMVLDVLRQPLEDRKISISRAKYKVDYPASFMLVGSMNPCPCGYAGESDGNCICSTGIIARYMSKISGPLMDRIDINIRVRPVESKILVSQQKEESSADIARRVDAGRDIQLKRFKDELCYTNSQMNAEQITRFCQFGEDEKEFLDKVINKYSLSARAYSRILKISRTIADLDNSENITKVHISEAVQYRFQETNA